MKIRTFIEIVVAVMLIAWGVTATRVSHQYRAAFTEQQEIILQQSQEIDSLIVAKTGFFGPVVQEDTNKLK